MSAVPLILVVGGDALALRVCEELTATQGHRVAILWVHEHELSVKLERLGCEYFPHAPNDYDALRIAGVLEAASIMTLSDDDRLNLQVGLKARDLNPGIRLVLRQFNRALGRKLEQNLRDCSVLSLASHSAAAFVATALDPSCFYALQFPDLDGVQAGFADRTASEWGIAGLELRAAERRLRARIIAVDGSPDLTPDDVLRAEQSVIAFARVLQLEATGGTRASLRVERRRRHLLRLRVGFGKRMQRLRSLDPILGRVAATIATIYALAVVVFAIATHRDPFSAFYFVISTLVSTSTGFGDVPAPEDRAGFLATVLGNFISLTFVAGSGLFIAFATAALTRAQFTAIQGLRQIRTRGHVILCGSGNVGTRAIEYLRALDQKVLVIDPAPDAAVVEMSRARTIELLTGDGTRDSTLDLCNIANARAVVVLTDSDTANLEVALGVRARNPQIPVVMRVQDDAFSNSIARQFEAIHTYSTTFLAAPAFAGLSRFPGTRGRIAFGSDTYTVGERVQGEVPQPPPAEDCIPLAVWRGGEFLHIGSFEEMKPFDRLLFLVPLSQFKPAPHIQHPAAAVLS